MPGESTFSVPLGTRGLCLACGSDLPSLKVPVRVSSAGAYQHLLRQRQVRFSRIAPRDAL